MATLNVNDKNNSNNWDDDIEVIPLQDADVFADDKQSGSSSQLNNNDRKEYEKNEEQLDKSPASNASLKIASIKQNYKNGMESIIQSREPDSRRQSDVASADGRSITSLSDTRSYRERIRDRISVVKERAGMSAIASQKASKTVHQKSTKQTAISRITDLLYKEEAELELALEKHRAAKESKRHKRNASEEENGSNEIEERFEEPNYQAALEFFTKTWDHPEDANQSVHSTPLRETTPQGDIEEDGDKLLAADYLGLRDTIAEPTEFRQPVIIKTELRDRLEQQLLFYPSTDPIAEEDRLGIDRKPRNAKEEGLYVANYPAVRKDNINKYHQRLVISKDLKWFGEDGEPIRLPDPLQQNYAKLPEFEEEPPYDSSKFVHYEPPLLIGEEQCNVPISATFVTSEECYVLDLEILNITFSHHPLFSKEHVLANRLLQLFEKYQHRQRVSYTKRLATRLEALRKARDNLIKILKREDDEEMANVHLERLNRYKREIRKTREQWMAEGKSDNQLLINLLSVWKELKKLREKQGYITTPIKLEITQMENPNQSEWEDEVRRQLSETIEEMKEDALKNAKDSLDLQKNFEQLNIDISLKHKQESGFIIDIEQMKQKIMAAVSESVLNPGEPLLNVCMAEQRVTQDQELSNSMEIQRRCLLKRSLMWYRVCYNHHEVCKSSPQSLNSQFICSFNQKITIRIQEWPEVLSVQIYCDGVPNKVIFNERPLAEIFIPIPGKGQTLDSIPVENYEFSSQQEVGSGVRHSGVGSGVPFKIFPDDNVTLCLHTTAVMVCKVGWGVHNDKILCPPEHYFTYVQSRRQYGPSVNTAVSDISKLKEWIKSAQLDPNDPNNASVFELLKKADSNIPVQSDEFKINGVQQMFDFCSEEELIKNPRLRLLMLRDKGEIEFKNIRAIPLREWEIPKDIFKTYEKRISSPELPFDTFGLGQLEIHRAWGQHSLNMIYDRILKQCRLSQQHRTTQDVVHEEKVPSIGTLGLTFMKLLQPKRPLRPRRKGRKKIPVKGLTGQEVKVIVNVVRAFEVPVRKDVDVLSEDNISYIRVRPFVEITFRGQTKRTVTADGPNPTWNQDLHFSLLGPNDSSFHVSSMRSFGDSLHLHLFDEIIVDILEDERRRNTTIHQRIERNWLGSLRIPISTLYFNQQVEGTFQLYSPPFLLGYDRQISSTSSDTSHLRNSTFLTLFIIVQPPLSPPDPIMEHLECNESSYLEQHLEWWAKEVTKQYPDRPLKTFITDTSGKSVCVTRFFQPIALPVIYDNEEITAEMIARYVSLIPISTSGALILGHFNVWLTCDQIVRLLLGEREDHAILLCCLFMKLGLKSWLLLGNGIPHGHSAYVLTRHDASLTTPTYNIWDPATGLKYSSLDSFSPLHKVYCLINDENIWVNIQTEEVIRRTNFDTAQQSDWWPAFDRNMPVPIGSVQPAVIEYSATSSTDVHLLQDKLEKYLRDSVMKWRPTLRTTWNRYCIAALRKLLPVLEREACGIKQNSLEHVNELQHILTSYKVGGFPISQPFSNMESILESVKSTGVHLNENPEVEFAIAVYIHPYPNDVLSVWVYAVSLITRR